ncbi:MAG: DUF4258 domain-containing protein [Candidatus Marinimicrobia bacterium]|nr:DUF4258 domain-containing protein [Candidatus Neomarinimicrobiota bacterium]
MSEFDFTNLRDILKNLQSQADEENIRVTQHAQQGMVEENVYMNEVFEAIASSDILENYPEHRRGPCCLLSGTTKDGKSLHIVCTTEQPVLIIITVYRPKQPKWVTPTQRRQRNEM